MCKLIVRLNSIRKRMTVTWFLWHSTDTMQMCAQTLNTYATFRHSSMIHIEYLFCLGRCKSPLRSFSNRILLLAVVVDNSLNILRIQTGNSSTSCDVVWNGTWLFWLICDCGVVVVEVVVVDDVYSFKMFNSHVSMAGVVVRTNVVGVVCLFSSCIWAECLSISFAPIFVGLFADHSLQNEFTVVALGGFGVVTWMNWPLVFQFGAIGVVVFGLLTMRMKLAGSLDKFNAI